MSVEREFIPVNVAVLTVSDTRTTANDTSGDYIADRLREAGRTIVARAIRPTPSSRFAPGSRSGSRIRPSTSSWRPAALA